MKGACTLITATVAASSAALSSSSGDHAFTPNQCAVQGKSMNSRVASERGKLAPKCDGLRFIETLVTGHSDLCRL
ncbi:hypothetical protein ACS0TY_021322 [Phlomoides rotata]